MESIVFENLKGGSGKTTSAINVATILATEYGQRVLVIDADGQGNATKSLMPVDVSGGLLYLSDYLRNGSGDMWRQYVTPSIIRGLDLIPADTGLWDPDLMGAGKALLRDLRDALMEAEAYDYMIVDCPPGFTSASINALLAASVVIIPSSMDGYSEDGALELVAQLSALRKVAPDVRVGGVLLTKWTKSDESRFNEALLRDGKRVKIYNTVIRQSPPVSKSTYGNGPVVTYSPRSAAAADYRKFVHEFLRREEAVRNGGV